MSGHSPLPWREGAQAGVIVNDGPSGQSADCIAYYGGHCVAESMMGPDVAFVLRAVTAHDALVAAANQVARVLAFHPPPVEDADEWVLARKMIGDALALVLGRKP